MAVVGNEETECFSAHEVLTELRPAVEEAIARWVPRSPGSIGTSGSATAIKTVLTSSRFGADLAAVEGSLCEPVWRVIGSGGKRWRAVLALLVGELLSRDPAPARGAPVSEFVADVAALAEIVHNGTLVIDDVEDSSDMRRGHAALHKSHGLDVALNAGNFMYFLPLAILQTPRKDVHDSVRLRCFELYATEMACVHAGQGADIWWHGGRRYVSDSEGSLAPEKNLTEPSVEQYLNMCANKTGSLARLAAKLAAVACGASSAQIDALGKFAESIGVAFQIQDDILNIKSGDGGTSELAKGKGGVGDDIQEGKRTIMVLHSFENASRPQAARLRELLDAHTREPADIAEAISIIEASGSVNFAQDHAKALLTQAWSEVDAVFPDASRAKSRLHSLAAFLIERNV